MYALVLAGGKGERLRPLTADRPKPMVPLAGKPILEHHLEWLKAGGVTHAVLLCGYMHEKIVEYFGDGSRLGMTVLYSVEQQPLGRGGAFKLGFKQVPAGEAFVIGTNGDNFHTQPLASLVQQHTSTDAVATVMLTPLRSPFGVAKLQGNHIMGFLEKPLLPHWVNAGVYALNREFFDGLPNVGDHENTLFPKLAAQGKLYAFRSRAYWKPIDNLKDLKEAEERLGATSRSTGGKQE